MSERTAALRGIYQAATSLLQSHGSIHVQHVHAPVDTRSFDCTLPEATPITSQLTAVGLDEELAIQVASAFAKNASKLKQSCEAKLLVTYQSYANLAASKDCAAPWQQRVRSLVERQYLAGLEKWTQDCVARARSFVAKANRVVQTNRGAGKMSFNSSAIPILDYAFTINPFPSSADRDFLAGACSMTRRQIDVWFQNKRSRTKKSTVNGKVAYHLEHRISLQELISHMKSGSSDESDSEYEEDMETPDIRVQPHRVHVEISTPHTGPFDGPVPDHAFPSIYPPSHRTKSSVTFSATMWPRLAHGSGYTKRQSITIHEVADQFSRLSLGEDDGTSRSAVRPQPTISTRVRYCRNSPLLMREAPYPRTFRVVPAIVAHPPVFNETTRRTLVSPSHFKTTGKRKADAISEESRGSSHNAVKKHNHNSLNHSTPDPLLSQAGGLPTRSCEPSSTNRGQSPGYDVPSPPLEPPRKRMNLGVVTARLGSEGLSLVREAGTREVSTPHTPNNMQSPRKRGISSILSPCVHAASLSTSTTSPRLSCSSSPCPVRNSTYRPITPQSSAAPTPSASPTFSFTGHWSPDDWESMVHIAPRQSKSTELDLLATVAQAERQASIRVPPYDLLGLHSSAKPCVGLVQ